MISYILTNPLKLKIFLLSLSVNHFLPLLKKREKIAKKGQKVENQFHFNPLLKGSRNFILFFQIHSTKNDTIHIEIMIPFGSLIAHSPRGLKQG